LAIQNTKVVVMKGATFSITQGRVRLPLSSLNLDARGD
jgi:hypothetical protein